MGDHAGFWREGIMTLGRRLLSSARGIGVLACMLLMACVLGYGTVSMIPVVLYGGSQNVPWGEACWAVMMLAVWLLGGAALLAARRRGRVLVVWTGVCWAALIGYPDTLSALWYQHVLTATGLAIIVDVVVAGVAWACLRPSALVTGLFLTLALLAATDGAWQNRYEFLSGRLDPPQVGTTAVAVDGRTGHAFAINADGQSISMVDTRRGALLRTVSLSGESLSSLVAAPEVGRVFALADSSMSTDGGLTLLDARTGALVRTLTLGPTGPLAVAVDARSGHAFVTTTSDVTMLDARRGTILRRIPVGAGRPVDIAVDERIGRAFLAVAQDLPEVCSDTTGSMMPGAVRILDTRTGATLRAIPVKNPMAIAVDRQVGHVVTLSDGGSPPRVLLLLDAQMGAVRASVPLSPASTTGESLTVDESASRAYVVDEFARSVTVLDDRTGAVLTTVDVSGGPSLSRPSWPDCPSPVVVDDRSGHAFVASSDGHSLAMLDSHTGRLVQTIALAQDAEVTAIAVDDQHSRVVVSALFTVASERAGRPGLVTILDARTGAILQTGRPWTWSWPTSPGPTCGPPHWGSGCFAGS